MKRIVLTGGGTAGHVTPHLALLPHLLARGYDVHYIGTANGIERTMMARPQVTYHIIQSGKLRRYFSWQNFTDPVRVAAGALGSARLMARLRPDVCFSKGGFVSVPVVAAAWLHRIPVLCHESDITPGLANRICTRFAQKVAATYPECARALGQKGVLTGTPLRPELFSGQRQQGLALAGFDGQKPVLLMTGGSLGAQSINAVLRQALPQLLPQMDIFHLCGKGNLAPEFANTPGYFQAEFLTDGLPHAFACADLVLSRAGATSLCEFQALKKPMLLIPYPKGASRGDQILNAESYRARGLAQVLLQENLTVDTLSGALRRLYAQRASLTKALENAPPADGTQAVLELIEAIQR